MGARKRVLITPLNWGLGHAIRCIPIIEEYIKNDWEVIIASDGAALVMLQKTFPDIESHLLPSYDIEYSADKNLMTSLLIQLPKMWTRIRAEFIWLKHFSSNNPLDLILSDNRFGMYSKWCKSIFISHQLQIRSPVFMEMLNRLNHKMINRFDECWIPDVEGPSNLSGELSTAEIAIPKKFIGILSNLKKDDEVIKDIPLLCILSGPEPQRTIIECELKPILTDYPGSYLIRGVMDDSSNKEEEGLMIKGNAGRTEIQDLMNRSRLVICRSGYTSIMDLVTVEKKAVLIPTPGQTEQEYLAERHAKGSQFRTIEQDEISSGLKDLISTVGSWGQA